MWNRPRPDFRWTIGADVAPDVATPDVPPKRLLNWLGPMMTAVSCLAFEVWQTVSVDSDIRPPVDSSLSASMAMVPAQIVPIPFGPVRLDTPA